MYNNSETSVQDKHVTTGRISQAGVNCGVKCRQGGTFENLRWKKEQLHELKQMRIKKEEERLQDDKKGERDRHSKRKEDDLADLESPPPLAES